MRLAVAIHGVAPGGFELCRQTRLWLAERGVDRVTLFVIPAADSQPFPGRQRRDVLDWLDARLAEGDCLAQLGFRRRPGDGLVSEWARTSAEEACEILEAGKRLLRLSGFDPVGFAPCNYAYTPALRKAAETCFDWHAERIRVPGAFNGTARARRPGRGSLGFLGGHTKNSDLLRLDLWPGDLADPSARESVERMLDASPRRAVTYEELRAPAAVTPLPSAGSPRALAAGTHIRAASARSAPRSDPW